MDEKENPIELLVMCVVVIVLSIAGIVAGFSRDLFGTLDGLLMLGVCLMMVLIFGILLYFLMKERGWLGKREEKSGPPMSSAQATK